MENEKKIIPPAGFKPMTSWTPVELRFTEEVFSTPSPSTHFAEQTEARMNSW